MDKVACIYRISHKLDYDNDNVYIGSTTDFYHRKVCHKSSCTNKNQRNHNTYLYQYIRENGGWEMFDCDILETCDADEEWRKQREQEYITAFKPKLNCINAYGEDKERRKLYLETNYEHKKAYSRKYHQENREEILKKQKGYREEHKEEVNNKVREYYEKNKEECNRKSREYREIHKEEISKQRREVIECECGKNSTRGNLSAHRKSKHHQEYLKFNEEK